ncbi:Seryl-tRNA synthetase [hydrothermal vent metagenome]|uniref:Serine--tRNA ligase n=1 Tax=hydrothermal vent metagenome TaxID=652676 RepID=A0A3B0R4I3_9ZZZZ
MHDIKTIRENPQNFDAAMQRRGLGPQSGALLELDEQRRSCIASKQAAETSRNAASKQIGAAKAKGDEAEFQRLRAEVGKTKKLIAEQDAIELDVSKRLTDLLLALPNIMDDMVPDGGDEAANVELRKVGAPVELGFTPKDHTELGETLGLLDFEAAAKISGARFAFLKGGLARLERALANFMLDVQTGENGFTEIAPPLLVRDNALIGTNQLPKFAGDQFQTTSGHWLIPTAEVPLTNLVRESIEDEADLPLRFCAYTPCFRSEAGSAGKDTRGLIRMHQFMKVEMVAICAPEQSAAEHERMTKAAESILQKLGLAYRVMLLCSGDTGFGAQKTHDLEVWLPSQNCYREISSISNCGAFQARRMNARCRVQGEKQIRFVHTLNGSGIAVGRALLAVMENYQNEDGTITVPEVLRSYMGGQEVIG